MDIITTHGLEFDRSEFSILKWANIGTIYLCIATARTGDKFLFESSEVMYLARMNNLDKCLMHKVSNPETPHFVVMATGMKAAKKVVNYAVDNEIRFEVYSISSIKHNRRWLPFYSIRIEHCGADHKRNLENIANQINLKRFRVYFYDKSLGSWLNLHAYDESHAREIFHACMPTHTIQRVDPL